ncbi:MULTISPECIES: hypothetical protein [unclassified Mesorhizobium]|uniref:hypothetical protein n=1 Tax=unclassified Mesorhizobium TaxID=325217 RepID=UPI00109374D3|nr:MULTISPECIES: hypothetical protein [unclassified Mesorhizobium]TGT82246.1 hypothetical protein EN804_31730 [Mesorhizobium sp. M8A.F.Ca.ET.161.01.1.1]TGV35524.1 hypothetical protein EN785_31855 [Mesorhizobium sp. M8A.F.Ca.ET.142.01.1.1]
MNREVDELATDTGAKHAVLDSLAALYPWTRSYHCRPLRDYASRLFEAPAQKQEPEIRSRALARLLDTIRNAGTRNGLPINAVSQICKDLEQRRVLQTGPHLFLLMEPEAYYTHIFSLLGLSAHGCSTYVSYAVSTVSLVEKPRKGPGWIMLDGKPVNVFGLSRSQMIGYSLLTGPGSYRFELVPTEPNAEGDAPALLRSLLPKTQFERPAHAIKAANRILWPNLFGESFAFLQIDDEDVADLVADHLSDQDSWLRTRLLESPKLALNILDEIDRLGAGPWGGWFARGTDFFWYYENGKRLPLRMVGGELVNLATRTKVARFAAPDIIERLANRSLVPNLLLMFLVLSILPGVRALGGSHQPVYYPLMRYVICRALETAEMDADLRRAIASDDVPGAWGHRVIECDENPFESIRKGSIGETSKVIDRFGNMPFADACGGLSSFVSDPSWTELGSLLRERAIAPSDPEWAFS